MDIEVAKRVAKKGIEERIVTKDQAKEKYRKWIENSLSKGGFDDYIISFWTEVIKQLDKV